MATDPGTHHLGTHGWLRLAVATALVLVFILTLEASPAAGASRKACRVENTGSAQEYERLQQAVDAAKPGARLVVTGTCHGGTYIDKDIAIVGQQTERGGKAVLDGDGRDRVLKVRRGVRVAMSDLTLQDGKTADRRGAGLVNRGTLRLTRVVVRNNRSKYDGGGIWNIGTLRLTDSRIRENETGDIVGGIYNDHGTVTLNGTSGINANLGQGVSNWGTLTMNDGSRISRNRFNGGSTHGGGVLNAGTLTMNDTSTISHNEAVEGGGVFNYHGALVMNGASSIVGNRVGNRYGGVGWLRPDGGGVYLDSGSRLLMTGSSVIRDNESQRRGGGIVSLAAPEDIVGVRCTPATDANVYGNSPDDCVLD
jgi:hypothetical protein